MLNKKDIFNTIIKNKSWPELQRFKKHSRVSGAVDHCRSFNPKQAQIALEFRKKWKGVSGIYKITFLPFRLFTYYGSSKNLGERLKYHYFNTPKQSSFLGLFLNIFGWEMFSVTIVELVPVNKLREREDWYLKTFMPLLNILMTSGADPRMTRIISVLTRYKISQSLLGRKHTDTTRALMSLNRSGIKNPRYGKSLPNFVLDAAAETKGIKIFAYDELSFSLVNGLPFRSLRATVKFLPVSSYKLPLVLDTGKAYKGFYYFSKAQSNKPAPLK